MVEITDHIVIGGGSMVTKDITEPGIHAGNPTKIIRSLPDK
jgi:acetyltransferase-like isoleucine patch superfamily enzyme